MNWEFVTGNKYDGDRLMSMTDPDGRFIGYNYASGIGNDISQLSSIYDNNGMIQSYQYLGLNTPVQETDGNGVQENVTFDAFGRIATENWINTIFEMRTFFLQPRQSRNHLCSASGE